MQTLSRKQCMELLSEQHFGRLAVDDGDGPLIVPVNYLLWRGSVLFRSDLGTKLAAAQDRALAAFEIDHVDHERRVGWSVLVRGRLLEIDRPGDLAPGHDSGLRPYVEGDGKHHFVRLDPRVVTGRLTRLPDDVPAGWYRAAVLGTHVLEEDRGEGDE